MPGQGGGRVRVTSRHVAVLKRFAQSGYDSYLCLEYEGDENSPLPNTLKCLEAIRRVIEEL